MPPFHELEVDDNCTVRFWDDGQIEVIFEEDKVQHFILQKDIDSLIAFLQSVKSQYL